MTGFSLMASSAAADDPLVGTLDKCIVKEIAVLQSDLQMAEMNFGDALGDVLLSGRHLFVCPTNELDGQGEGEDGPRSGQRADMWPAGQEDIAFLRLNGLGAQRCWECHNSAGVYDKPIAGFDSDVSSTAPGGFLGPWRAQKPGGTGGAAGFSNTLFQNASWPMENSQGETSVVNIVRSPPSVFGTGYLQRLAYEMTVELLAIKEDTIRDARNSPTGIAESALKAKTSDFGTLRVTCNDAACEDPQIEGYEGVSEDLIVRPLQHKGISSTVRHFVMSALDFHMSLQPVELVGVNNDCDKDGHYNEMATNTSFASSEADINTAIQESLGSVTAMTAWTGLVRPPQFQPVSADALDGKKLFETIDCVRCHTPSMRIARPIFSIQNPEIPDMTSECPSESEVPALGSNTVSQLENHPVMVERRSPKNLSGCADGFYCIDLSNVASDDSQSPPFISAKFQPIFDDFLPRLPRNSDLSGSIDVPLYSDLKRHKMGSNLRQVGAEQEDDTGNAISNDEWLTTKLWGVGDSGPWLHDGRARSLDEAIRMHKGDGSEANAEVANYEALSEDEKLQILVFLSSLRLPSSPPTFTDRPIFDGDNIAMLNPITNVSTRALTLTDKIYGSGRVKRLMNFLSRDANIQLPERGAYGDPTSDGMAPGGRLVVYNSNGLTEQVEYNLPAENWKYSENPVKSFVFTGDSSHPVKKVVLKRKRISIRAGGEAWDYTLQNDPQGSVALNLTVGDLVWCASAPPREATSPGNPNQYDRTGYFRAARNSPAPSSCPVAPSGF